ncbi:MAG TPA: DMT family transporter [Trebonia sp.]
MDKAVFLAVAAALCTATASVCQRAGARNTGPAAGFDARLIVRLARQPAWLLGIAAMIGGFAFQLTALRFGELALVQPILAAELLFVFGYLAVAGSRRPRLRDWLAAAAMSAGIGVFLGLASPSTGRQHAPGSAWLLAGLVTTALVVVAVWAASGSGWKLRRDRGISQSRRAALLGVATGISWGFVAAIIKEFSSHLGGGIGALFTTWSPYALIAVGAATMMLASQALAAGPLAASQPGFTVLDPLSATLLGEFLFAEHLRTQPVDLLLEAGSLAVVVAGASILSHSCLIQGADGNPPCAPVERTGRKERVLQMPAPPAKHSLPQSQSLTPNGSSRLPSSPPLPAPAEKHSELSNAERS